MFFDGHSIAMHRVVFSFAGAGVSVLAFLAKTFLHQGADVNNIAFVSKQLCFAFAEGAVAGLTFSVTFIGDNLDPGTDV